MAQSVGFLLYRAFAVQLKAAAETAAAVFVENPALPIDMKGKGERVLFVLRRGDRLVDQPGVQPERRIGRVIVGAVALTKAGPEDADALHFAARDLLKSLAFRGVLKEAGGTHDLREIELEPELREVVTEGSMLMSAYEFEYMQTYPSFAL